MNKVLSSILLVILCGAVSLSGTACHHEEAATDTSETTVKSMSSYYDEADKAITAENAEAELKKLMGEIDSDTE